MGESHVPVTELINPETLDLDLLSTPDLLHRINDEDRRAVWAVEREIDAIADAVERIAERLKRGGKLHYFGAGTSGRIAVLDAAEIAPTFSARGVVVAHIAGGARALAEAVEGAEDDAAAGSGSVRESRIGSNDVAIGLSAGGRTPYVIGAMQAARDAGALTIAITSDPESPLAKTAERSIVFRTGPEVIAGSTRMKAGVAQKMTLTMISTAVMVKLGRVYGNLMVEVDAGNEKLRARAVRLTEKIARSDAATARRALEQSGYEVKTAVVMLRCRCDAAAARALLAKAGGNLRTLLEAGGRSS